MLKKQTPLLLLGLIAVAWLAPAQDSSAASTSPAPRENSHNVFSSLTGDLLQGDFVNYYAFANAIFDSVQQTVNSGRESSGGAVIGGGITVDKAFRTGFLSLNYRGDYRNYSSGFQASGTNQYLSLVYTKQLSTHWSFALNTAAGILFYSSAYYPNLGPAGSGVDTNPLSPTNRFISSGAYLTYRQNARLSYIFGATFYLSRYSFPGSIGSTGGSGSASVSYRLTARTRIGGTYSHTNYYFQHDAGTSNIDGGFANVSHTFGYGLSAQASGGVTRAHTDGQIPVTFEIAGIIYSGFERYNTVKLIPTVQGAVTKTLGLLRFGGSIGRGVNPGNGSYLTSTHTYFGAFASRNFGRTGVLTANLYYSRIAVIARQESQGYTQNSLNVTYSRTLIPHISATFSYSNLRYGGLAGLSGTTDNRVLAGLAFSKKNVPISNGFAF